MVTLVMVPIAFVFERYSVLYSSCPDNPKERIWFVGSSIDIGIMANNREHFGSLTGLAGRSWISPTCKECSKNWESASAAGLGS